MPRTVRGCPVKFRCRHPETTYSPASSTVNGPMVILSPSVESVGSHPFIGGLQNGGGEQFGFLGTQFIVRCKVECW